jgi:hypothetical protein
MTVLLTRSCIYYKKIIKKLTEISFVGERHVSACDVLTIGVVYGSVTFKDCVGRPTGGFNELPTERYATVS